MVVSDVAEVERAVGPEGDVLPVHVAGVDVHDAQDLAVESEGDDVGRSSGVLMDPEHPVVRAAGHDPRDLGDVRIAHRSDLEGRSEPVT